MNEMLKDKAMLEQLGFEVISIDRPDWSNCTGALVEKYGERARVDIWYNGDMVATAFGRDEYFQFKPVVAYFSRTANFKTLEGFAKSFDKRFKK